MIRLFTLLLVLSLGYPLWSQTRSIVNVNISSKTRLCPPKVGSGDREFDGHGPVVAATADLSMIGLTRVRLTLTLHTKETRSDWTEARGSWTYDIYNVPSGYKIIRIVSATASRANYTDSNHSLDRPAVTGGNLVSRFEIMGDTGGNDVGNCTTDDVYMNVIFNTVQVEIQKLEVIVSSFGFNSDFPQQVVNKMSRSLHGVTHDNQYWYFSQSGDLWKIPRSKNLASIDELADEDMVRGRIPPYLQRNGYNRFGDMDHYQGFLWVSLEGEGRVADRPLIAVFRASDLELVTTISMQQWQNSIGCVAINPATGYLFASVAANTTFLNKYRININGEDISLTAPLRFNLYDANSNSMSLAQIRAAAFSADGRYLFVSEDRTSYSRLTSFNHRTGKYMYGLVYGAASPPQGVTFWATGTTAPGIPGNLHLLMRHPDPVEGDGYTFRNYTIQEAYDWNG